MLGSSGTAFARSRAARGRARRSKGRPISVTSSIKAAKKEGHLNTIALPPDWANYGEMMSTFSKKYGIKITNDNPNGSSAEENQAIARSRATRAHRRVDVGVSFAIAGRHPGPLREVLQVSHFATIPRAMKDTRGLWWGDYWGAISIGYNGNLISNPPKTWKDLLKPEYKGKVAMNGSPLSSDSAVSGVIAASLGNGGSLNNVGPGIDFFATLKKSGNFIPVHDAADGRVGPDADLDRLGLQQPRLHQGVPGSEVGRPIPSDGVYGGYYAQAINATAPHPWAARLWQEFIYSDQGQLLFLKGFAHPARFNDLAEPQEDPGVLLTALPASRALREGAVREHPAADRGEDEIATDWPAKVGS